MDRPRVLVLDSQLIGMSIAARLIEHVHAADPNVVVVGRENWPEQVVAPRTYDPSMFKIANDLGEPLSERYTERARKEKKQRKKERPRWRR